ncbi:MAG TPA: hypothetical protein VFW94_04305 [Candidatus Acidoferrales bacterium]|nr:hypothetical protein [Candidatus Acidoferrales bacterium]
MPTKQQLMDRIKELEEENDELQDSLDSIADIAAPPDEDSGQDEADEDEGDDSSDDDENDDPEE